jgi:hypothetical protein
MQWHTSFKQSAEEHIAGDTGKAIEVSETHILFRLGGLTAQRKAA